MDLLARLRRPGSPSAEISACKTRDFGMIGAVVIVATLIARVIGARDRRNAKAKMDGGLDADERTQKYVHDIAGVSEVSSEHRKGFWHSPCSKACTCRSDPSR